MRLDDARDRLLRVEAAGDALALEVGDRLDVGIRAHVQRRPDRECIESRRRRMFCFASLAFVFAGAGHVRTSRRTRSTCRTRRCRPRARRSCRRCACACRIVAHLGSFRPSPWPSRRGRVRDTSRTASSRCSRSAQRPVRSAAGQTSSATARAGSCIDILPVRVPPVERAFAVCPMMIRSARYAIQADRTVVKAAVLSRQCDTRCVGRKPRGDGDDRGKGRARRGA